MNAFLYRDRSFTTPQWFECLKATGSFGRWVGFTYADIDQN